MRKPKLAKAKLATLTSQESGARTPVPLCQGFQNSFSQERLGTEKVLLKRSDWTEEDLGPGGPYVVCYLAGETSGATRLDAAKGGGAASSWDPRVLEPSSSSLLGPCLSSCPVSNTEKKASNDLLREDTTKGKRDFNQ